MASHPNAQVRKTLSRIQGAGLPHPIDELLCAFVLEAVDPEKAASYVEQSCNRGADEKECLLSLASDWRHIVECMSLHGRPPPAPAADTAAGIARRDGGRCCITGKAGTRRDPLVVAPILPVPVGWLEGEAQFHMLDILGAFFTPPYRDWWLEYIGDPRSGTWGGFHNHWLVRRSAAKAFVRGTIRLDRLRPSMIEFEVNPVVIGLVEDPPDIDGRFPVLGDHSRKATPTVDARFLGTQARLSTSIRWLAVSEHIRLNKQPRWMHKNGAGTHPSRRRAFWRALSGTLQSVCLAAWRAAPARVRGVAYGILQRIGRRMYGATNSQSVQRLPFGLYLKCRRDAGGLRNEFSALQMVRRHTSIPVPRPLDVVSVPKGFKRRDEMGFLLTTCLPGRPLVEADQLFSDEDLSGIVSQMQDYLIQLRSVPKTAGADFAICNTLGGACRDNRLCWEPVGPFVDEASFNRLLRNPDDPARRGHMICFTHADLNLRNMLVDEVPQADGTRAWRVTGIVDWETAGFYPEYWDYTKALFESFRYGDRLRRMIHDVFGALGDYANEVAIEQRSWKEGDYI